MMPVVKNYCSLRDLQEYYSIDDLYDMLEAIELESYINELYLMNGDGDKVTRVIDGSG